MFFVAPSARTSCGAHCTVVRAPSAPYSRGSGSSDVRHAVRREASDGHAGVGRAAQTRRSSREVVPRGSVEILARTPGPPVLTITRDSMLLSIPRCS